MKSFLPLALACLAAACSTPEPTPEPGTDAHQRRLAEQARENFLALKAQERERRGYPAQAPADERPPITAARGREIPRTYYGKPAARTDDTIYEPTAQGRAEVRAWELRKAQEYRAYEAREARKLGTTPDRLTAEERAWIRERAE